MKPKTKLLTLVFIVGIIIVAFIFVMTNLIKEANECVKNPFIYANKLIVDNEGNHVYSVCSCQVGSIGYFYFDDEGLYESDPLYSNQDTNEINLPDFDGNLTDIGRVNVLER